MCRVDSRYGVDMVDEGKCQLMSAVTVPRTFPRSGGGVTRAQEVVQQHTGNITHSHGLGIGVDAN